MDQVARNISLYDTFDGVYADPHSAVVECYFLDKRVGARGDGV
jgi:hypothetical protein